MKLLLRTSAVSLPIIMTAVFMLIFTTDSTTAQDKFQLSSDSSAVIGKGVPALTGQVLDFNPPTIKKLTDLGILKPREVSSMLQKLLFINAISSNSSSMGGGFGYTSDSQTNLCTCDNTDPLDCLLIWDDCSGPLEPSVGGQICHRNSGDSCSCRWK